MAYLSGTSEIQKKSRKFTKSRVACEPLGIACPNKYLHDQCHEPYLCVKYEALMFRNAKNKFLQKKVKKRAQSGTNNRQNDCSRGDPEGYKTPRGQNDWSRGGPEGFLLSLPL